MPVVIPVPVAPDVRVESGVTFVVAKNIKNHKISN